MSIRNRNNMPEGFEPPVPAWAAKWPDSVSKLTSGFFAVQGPIGEKWRDWTATAFKGKAAPELVETASFIDANDIENTVVIAYWRNDSYSRWWARPDVASWWSDPVRLNESAGYWREIFHVPVERIETLHSTLNKHGIATLANELDGPIDEHAYPGAARDRIPVSGADTLSGPVAVERTIPAVRTDDGKRVVVRPVRNMCVIRSGQDWSGCGPDERRFYLKEVEPNLRIGMDYLRDNPDDTRCLSMRLMQNIDQKGGKMEQTFGLGYALDIYAFEEWAKSHPTHLAIFNTFMSYAEKFGENMLLKLWHEVSVMTGEDAEFEYIDCHPQTGLLPYASA